MIATFLFLDYVFDLEYFLIISVSICIYLLLFYENLVVCAVGNNYSLICSENRRLRIKNLTVCYMLVQFYFWKLVLKFIYKKTCNFFKIQKLVWRIVTQNVHLKQTVLGLAVLSSIFWRLWCVFSSVCKK